MKHAQTASKNSSAHVFAGVLCVLLAAPAAAAEEIVYQTGFEEGKEGPTGWEARGGAQWAEFARTGKRSIEIRSWQPDALLEGLIQEKIKDPDNAKAIEGKIRIDPKKCSWIGPVMSLSGLPTKVSFWGASHITYMNDESFRAQVGLLPCKPDGTFAEIPVGGLVDLTKSGKPLHFYRHQRENYQLYARAVPDAVLWEYKELVLKPGKGTYRMALHFSKEPDGQVWVDDLVVSESADYKTKEELVAAAAQAKPSLPWEMQINFPVSFNLFRKGDPLQADVAVIGRKGLPDLKAGMKLVYEVRDFNFRWVFGGEKALGDGPFNVWKAPESFKTRGRAPVAKAALELDGHVRLVPLDLPKALAAHEGKLLFLKIALDDGERRMAEDEVTFAIIVPGETKPENLWRGGKVVEKWGASPDLKRDFCKAEPDYNGLTYKAGGQWNSVPLRYVRWPGAQKKSKDAPIDLGTEPPVYESHGFLLEHYILQSYRRWTGSSLPQWAIDKSPESIKKYGYWVFDRDAWAKYLQALVKRMHQQFPNATAICPTAGEVPQDQWRFELQQLAYKSIKGASPTTNVGVWYWGGETAVLESYQDSYDFFDTEFYADPRTIGKEGPKSARKHSQRLGRQIFSVINEGCALTGSEEQEESARGVFDTHMFQWANGNNLIGQFEFGGAYTQADGSPLLRAALHADFGGTGHNGGAKRVKLTRYDMVAGKNIRTDYGWHLQHYQPALPTVAYCNLIRFLDSSVFERAIRMREAYVFVFEHLGQTVLYLESKGMDDWNVEISGVSGTCETLDIHGYRYALGPLDGKLLATVSHFPLVLMFDSHLKRNAIKVRKLGDVQVKMTRPIVKMSPGVVTVQLGAGRTGGLTALVDPRMETPASVAAAAGQPAKITVTPLEARPTGKYRTYVRVTSGGKAYGLLSVPLEVRSAGVDAALAGIPMTPASDPALRVTLRNSTDVPANVNVSFLDRYTLTEARPLAARKAVIVPSDGSTDVDFPLNRTRVKLNRDYRVSVELTAEKGVTREVSDTVHFRGVPKRTQPIVVDADLRDWPLDKLLPLEPTWLIMIGGRTGLYARSYYATWERQTRPRGRYKTYFVWDEEGIYFCGIVNNPQRSRPLKNPPDFWAQDCMYLTMYYDKYVPGAGSIMRPFKMHLAMDEAGKPYLVDLHAKVIDPKEAGLKYAAKETDTGYIYEYFMGRPHIGAFKLEPGSGFSASTVAYHKMSGPVQGLGVQRGTNNPRYAFYRHCFDFDGGIEDMARFILTKE